jgi:DNA-binding NarL/FixJ family response regulator
MATEHMSPSIKPGGKAAARRADTSVWLVEDNRTFRDTLARVLSRVEGLARPRVFGNAEDALEALKEGGAPDVVLLDVQLPGASGLEAVRSIKAISLATRVIMLTVFDDHQKIFKAICAGASGYLLKTAPVERIVEAIREVLAGGAPMNPKVAHSVLDMFARLAAPKSNTGLSDQERRILDLMTRGLIKKEIAARLELSFHTVDSHLRNIYTKLHVHNSSGAVAKALADRLI